MQTYKWIASLILVTMIQGFFSINIIKKNKETYQSYNYDLINKNKLLETELKSFYEYGVIVNVTMYRPNVYETDSTPNITADGTRFSINKASDYKYVALARNLLKRWGGAFDYGDFILIKGTKDKDGVYNVRDTMNPKYVNYVDILESKNVSPYKYENVHIYKMRWTDNVQLVSNTN
jgi:hypothetical protein